MITPISWLSAGGALYYERQRWCRTYVRLATATQTENSMFKIVPCRIYIAIAYTFVVKIW